MKQPDKAGGFPSVKSTVNQLIRSKKVRENMVNLYRVNKHHGFDCPGCAWGDEKDGTFRFCENGAKAIAWEQTGKQVDAAFFQQHSVSYLRKQTGYWLESQGRLAEPMQYNPATDHYEPISWEDAFTQIAAQINQLVSPDELELYTSGRASNEASFLYQLFGRSVGTNNFPDCSNMCHEASGIALKQAIGVGKGTVTLKDFTQADTIFVFGQNPGTNHPRMLNALSKAAKRGASIVTFNNLREVALERFASPQKPAELLGLSAVNISSHYFTPKLGGDFAAARGIAKVIFEQLESHIDSDFVASHTAAFDEYKAVVESTPWQAILSQSGLSKAEIDTAARVFVSSKRTITCWAMGITQHLHSVDTIRELSSLHLLTGAIGLPGAGLCPVRGHSNVQGNRTMGIMEQPPEWLLSNLEQHANITRPANSKGHRVVDAINALAAGESKMLICLGGNIAAAAPDSAYTENALCKADMLVNIATKLNRTHVMATNQSILLPCLGRTESDVQQAGSQTITVEDTFSMVHGSMGTTDPVSSNIKSETEIVARIAQAALGQATSLDWQAFINDYGNIRELIGQIIPGFENFNAKIEKPGGFKLYNAAAHLEWQTESGKANFNTAALPPFLFPESVHQKVAEQAQSVFVMQTLRSHDQYNTTIYGMNDRYRGIQGERNVVFMNAKDITRAGFSENQLVDMQSVWNDEVKREVKGFRIQCYDIPEGNIACYYPEGNPLIPFNSVGEQSDTATSKAIPVIMTLSQHIAVKNT